jgi:glycosyltransferase involved in cell wall biosynthesis
MICYYFPPLGMGGTQRPAKFAKYLPEFGWQPTVVTVNPVSYWVQDPSMLDELTNLRIIRTESFDPQRLMAKLQTSKSPSPVIDHKNRNILSFINQKLLPFMLVPDSKILWGYHLYHTVTDLLRKETFDAMYTTSPPHSVHLIGKMIARSCHLKWIADFRDAWAGSVVVHEPTPLHRSFSRHMQKSILQSADAVLCITGGLLSSFKEFYPPNAGKMFHIPNGYDETDYPPPRARDRSGKKFVFCHCGSISKFSHPGPLFQALDILRQQDPAVYAKIRFDFVGLDARGDFSSRIAAFDCIHWHGYKSHGEALSFLSDADALLLVAQGRPDDTFIPGKIYEYFGSQKPVLAITNVQDTINLLKTYPRAVILDPADPGSISRAIKSMISKKWPRMDRHIVEQWSRRRQAEQLAEILNQLTVPI